MMLRTGVTMRGCDWWTWTALRSSLPSVLWWEVSHSTFTSKFWMYLINLTWNPFFFFLVTASYRNVQECHEHNNDWLELCVYCVQGSSLGWTWRRAPPPFAITTAPPATTLDSTPSTGRTTLTRESAMFQSELDSNSSWYYYSVHESLWCRKKLSSSPVQLNSEFGINIYWIMHWKL